MSQLYLGHQVLLHKVCTLHANRVRSGSGVVKPLHDRIVVERLEGHGIERTLPSGIIVPATAEQGIQAKRDTFRARVVAMSEGAARQLPDLKPTDEVLVYAYSGREETVFTGVETSHGLIVEPDDILCAVEGT
jgi:co-chaperonin GroES (HSP10)